MTKKRFTSTLTRSGARAIISVPFDPNEAWGHKDRHYVSGSVNGMNIRARLESAGKKFFFSLGPAWRRDNALDEGAKVDVVLYPEGPQSEELSPDVSSALAAEPDAKAFFDSLASFYRKNFIRRIESAKRPETRAVRIEEMIKCLKAGQRGT
jgi:hypothetical protein